MIHLCRLLYLNALAALVLGFVCNSSTVAHAQQAPANPIARYVIGPPNSDKTNHGLCFRELFEHPDDWKQTRSLTDALLYADWSFQEFSDAELTAWFAQMHQWNIKLELEVGGIKPWGRSGEGTFTKQKPRWDRLERLGGNIHAVAMDEPLCSVRRDFHKPDEWAVEETSNFIALARKNFPEMLVGDIEPYPYLPLAEQIKWITALQKRLAEKHVRGLDFYRVDVDWLTFDVRNKGSWNEVKKLQLFCQSVKVPFSLIYWSPGMDFFKRRGIGDDSTWLTGVMSQGYAYASVGGKPDQYVLESWVNAPAHSVPETADYTFCRSALDFGRKFVKPAN